MIEEDTVYFERVSLFNAMLYHKQSIFIHYLENPWWLIIQNKMLHATSMRGSIVIQPVDFRDWIRSICNEYRSLRALYLACYTRGSKSPFEHAA